MASTSIDLYNSLSIATTTGRCAFIHSGYLPTWPVRFQQHIVSTIHLGDTCHGLLQPDERVSMLLVSKPKRKLGQQIVRSFLSNCCLESRFPSPQSSFIYLGGTACSPADNASSWAAESLPCSEPFVPVTSF